MNWMALMGVVLFWVAIGAWIGAIERWGVVGLFVPIYVTIFVTLSCLLYHVFSQ